MAITSIKRDFSDEPNIVRIISSDTLATVSASNYILNQAANIIAINNGAFEWNVSDMVLVYASDGWGLFTITSNFHSLTSFVAGNGGVILPVTANHIPQFKNTLGQIYDNGLVPSSASQSILASVSSATVIGDLASFSDVDGTIQDSGVVANKVLQSSFASPDANANIIVVNFNNILNANIVAGTTLFAPTGSKTYLLIGAILTMSSAFSGGSNNSALSLSIGSNTSPSIITATHTILAATAQSYALGQAGFTFVSTAPNSTISSTNTLNITANVSSDYTSGDANFVFLLQRTA